ncbi:unnamed protein product [marine sediment metagenome]|uniref:SAP domain-containing protein n=1 Tax=marine sediment metagenome TaxID=412755 RepID=X1ER80_9ZZZZ
MKEVKAGWLQQACLDMLYAQGGGISDWSSFHSRLTALEFLSRSRPYPFNLTNGPELVAMGWNPSLKPAIPEVSLPERPRVIPTMAEFNRAWTGLEKRGLVKIERSWFGSISKIRELGYTKYIEAMDRKYSLAELKELCRQHGVSASGAKKALIRRLFP